MNEQQLDTLLNAINYTRGTISHLPQQAQGKPDWVLIHKGRAHQSMAFLDQAKDIVTQAKQDLKIQSA
jgi:hypothetical protein